MKHALHKYSFDELLTGLEANTQAGFITVKHKDNLALYNYSNECTFTKTWNDFTLSARGLILDIVEKRIVSLPFPKFFNFNELDVALPNEPFEVYEKYDGSLGICYFYDGEWHISTRGSFDSDQAIWATKWLREHLPPEFNDPWVKEFTLLCEIIYPANKIVVDYKGWEGLVLLTVYDNTNFLEYPPYTVSVYDSVKKTSGWKLCTKLEYQSLDDLIKVAKQLSHAKEGFVVKFESGHRIKIKGDEYSRIHKLISRITPLGVYESIINGDNLETVLLNLPEEFHRDYKNIYNLLHKQHQKLELDCLSCLGEWIDSGQEDSRKNFALFLHRFPAQIRGAMFLIYDERFEESFKMLWKGIRPIGNKLEGYTPSSILDRFKEVES